MALLIWLFQKVQLINMDKQYNKTFVFWAACMGMFLFGISFITLGSVTASLRTKFMLSDVAAGTLFAILPMGIIVGSMLFGPIADRLGYKIVFIVSTLLLFAGFMGIAYSPSLGLLKVFIFLFGLGGGALNGATNAVVSLISDTNKVGRLSLLGVFYGIGALGMPFILGSLQAQFPYQTIIAAVSLFTLVISFVFLAIRFPTAVHDARSASIKSAFQIFNKPVIIFVSAFLFFQMSLEAIVNNWTTTYLQVGVGLPESNALYALSVYVLGITVMRVLIGSVLNRASERQLLSISLLLMLIGILTLFNLSDFSALVIGLFLLGAGMSAGVPLMLGIVGGIVKEGAGTAFSIVIVIGLLGNLSLNYLMGLVTEVYGIQFYVYGLLLEWLLLTLLSIFIIRSIKYKQNKPLNP